MLPRQNRLNLAAATWRFRGSDYESSSPLFKIIAKRNQRQQTRVGFLITGKLGKAARRNLVRRRLTEAVVEKFLKLPAGFDLIFIAYPRALESSYEEICASLDKVLPKISLLR